MRALICGVGGQDGTYLAQFLLNKGYEVIGVSRDATTSSFGGLKALGIRDRVLTDSMAISDFRSVLQTLNKYCPDEIYNLAGQSSVALSFEQPVETMESVGVGTLNMLEAIRFHGRPVRFYSAGSSESFGDTRAAPADEETPFKPRSPYAVAKVTAHNLVANYREGYSLYACTGILFNHESPLRPERFVTQKIAMAAARIAAGAQGQVEVGNVEVQRDWGWAPEYVEAMWKMLQLDDPQDFVIATGKTVSLEYFIDQAFQFFGLDWRNHVSVNSTLLRPTDVRTGAANPKKANRLLGWQAQIMVDGVVERMCLAARDKISRPG